MRRPLVAGNWKLHGTRAGVTALVDSVLAGMPGLDGIDVLVCPTFVHVAEAGAHLADTALALGAQDVSAEREGAFTGEVAAGMLAEYGCGYAIVGHSERRARHGETDAGVAAKVVAAAHAGLVPIVCIGETLAQRDVGDTLDVVRRQLQTVLDAAGTAAFTGSVVAYEPVWAIGTGRTATPEQAQEVHAAVRAVLMERSPDLASDTRILYGGSVKASNAAELFGCPDIDGALVGGASLDAIEFLNICRTAADIAAAD